MTVPLTDPAQIPKAMSESEARAFFCSHHLTEECLAKMENASPNERPRRPDTENRRNA